MPVSVKVKKGNFDKAMKRFKRLVKEENILQDFRKHEFYEKPSQKRRRKRKAT